MDMPTLLGLAIAGLAALPLAAQTGPAPRRLAVRAAHMIDVVAGARVDNPVILIEGDRITQVGSALAIPAGTRTIDLGPATLLPGLIDVHTHLSSQSGDYYTDLFRRSPIDNAIRRQVRENIKRGADVIKVLAGAGVLSEEQSAGAPQYSQEELNALVAEAAMWDRKVAAHAHGAEAIKRAVKAGVASVEHGGLVDEETVRLMTAQGTFLVPDIYTDVFILEHGAEQGLPANIMDKEKWLRGQQDVNWARTFKAGVKFAFGTDAGVYPHGQNARQFALLVKHIGMTPADAIRTATLNAAELIGWSDKVGRLAPGYYADLIAVGGNPLTDVTELERVRWVMKGGIDVTASPLRGVP